MKQLSAPAKINLALVAGPRGRHGKHELMTVYQRVDLADRIALEPGDALRVDGFARDLLVAEALRAIAAAAGVEPHWHASIEKRIPVAAGLGGGSSDAAAALRLANELLEHPLPPSVLHEIAAGLGADVPFFLEPGPQLGQGDGTTLSPLDVPQDYAVLLLVPAGENKASTAAVYEEFDRRGGERGYAQRCAELRAALAAVQRPADLAALPANDLAASPLTGELERLGAFRADVSGAGPVVYGLFEDEEGATAAARQAAVLGRVWVAAPTWYG